MNTDGCDALPRFLDGEMPPEEQVRFRAHLAGCDAYIGFLDEECACSAGAPCANACASYCGGGNFDAACDTCFNQLGDNACWEAAYTACVANAACNEYVSASEASCASLP